MTITLLAFGKAKESLGSKALQLNFDWEITIDELRNYISNQYPGLEILPHCRLAVNQTFIDEKKVHRLSDGDEIAIIPPVSGG